MRLFIGIAPDRHTRAVLRETVDLLRPNCPGRYADASLYHMTLAFLGEYTPAQAAQAVHAMRTAAEEQGAFPATLAGLGLFGTILWRGIAPCPEADLLARRLRKNLHAQELPFDGKPFRLHFTLARNVRPACGLDGFLLPPAEFTARSMTLYESTREQGSLVYLPRSEVPLS